MVKTGRERLPFDIEGASTREGRNKVFFAELMSNSETVENRRVRKSESLFSLSVQCRKLFNKDFFLYNHQLLLHRSEITKPNICELYLSFGYYN